MALAFCSAAISSDRSARGSPTADIYAVVYSYMPEDQTDNTDDKVLLFVDNPESEEIYNKFSELFEASHPVE